MKSLRVSEQSSRQTDSRATARFYSNIQIFLEGPSDLVERLKKLMNQVASRLPDEEQFGMKGLIWFRTRANAIEFWRRVGPNPLFGGKTPDLTPLNRDGNCAYIVGENLDSSRYFITIIIDQLHIRSDNYIKGLIVHELSEMSYMFRLVQKEMPILLKMGRKARDLRLAEIGSHAPVGSPQHEQREHNVNQEAIRLGFVEEIEALESGD